MLRDLDTAPIAEGLRVTLRLLETMTLSPDALSSAEIAACKAAGVTTEQIRDAIWVAVCFNTIVRLADAFKFTLLDQDGYNASARSLLRFGYRV